MNVMGLKLKDVLTMALSAVAGCVLGCMLAAAVMRASLTPKIAVADVQALTAKAANRLGLEDVPEEELKARVGDFTDRLKVELRTLAAQKNLVILKPQAVLEGAQDLTALIEEQLNREDRP